MFIEEYNIMRWFLYFLFQLQPNRLVILMWGEYWVLLLRVIICGWTSEFYIFICLSFHLTSSVRSQYIVSALCGAVGFDVYNIVNVEVCCAVRFKVFYIIDFKVCCEGAAPLLVKLLIYSKWPYLTLCWLYII